MSALFTIFGASGDLTKLASWFRPCNELFRKQRLPEGTKVVGVSRTHFSDDEWRSSLAKTTEKFVGKNFDPAFGGLSSPRPLSAGRHWQRRRFRSLARRLDQLDGGGKSTRVYYRATAPQFYSQAVAQLGAAGQADLSKGIRRIRIEKPFGTDLATAKALNAEVIRFFQEQQEYRIDHYLGKETVQSILGLAVCQRHP